MRICKTAERESQRERKRETVKKRAEKSYRNGIAIILIVLGREKLYNKIILLRRAVFPRPVGVACNNCGLNTSSSMAAVEAEC
jgi:hypothetical protein